MRRSLQEKSKKLKAANLRVLVQTERYFALSGLSPKEQEDCREEVYRGLEKAEKAGVSYRNVTGPNLRKYCDRLIASHRQGQGFCTFGKLLLQIQLQALITGGTVAVLESVAWTHTALGLQKISVWLVYGMAILERIIDLGMRKFAGRNLFRGYPFFYEKRYLLEWCVLLASYVGWCAFIYITPVYHQATVLRDMLCLMAVTGCFYGCCILADAGIPILLARKGKQEHDPGTSSGRLSDRGIWTGIGVLCVIALIWSCQKYLITGAGWKNSLMVFGLMVLTAVVMQRKERLGVQ